MVHGAQSVEIVLRNGDRLGIEVELDVAASINSAQQSPPRMHITFRDYLIVHSDIPTLIETMSRRIKHNVKIRMSHATTCWHHVRDAIGILNAVKYAAVPWGNVEIGRRA